MPKLIATLVGRAAIILSKRRRSTAVISNKKAQNWKNVGSTKRQKTFRKKPIFLKESVAGDLEEKLNRVALDVCYSGGSQNDNFNWTYSLFRPVKDKMKGRNAMLGQSKSSVGILKFSSHNNGIFQGVNFRERVLEKRDRFIV